MATSGSFDFTLNRNEIIEQALRTLNVIGDGDSANADQISDGAVRLNMMIKAWRAKGISLPLYDEITVYLEKGKQSYLIGATGDKATATPQKTELAVAGSNTDTTITVDSDDDIANGDNIGVVLDDGTIHWTTVNGAPAANVVTLTDALTGAAAIDNHVYSYTTIAQRPLTVKDARLIINDGNEIPVKVATREEYYDQPDKTSQGTITLVYYDPQITNGVLHVWQPTDTVNNTLQLTVQRQVADFDNPTDNADFPVEWLEPLVYNLAQRMVLKYGVDQATRVEVEKMAVETLAVAEDFDQEDTFYFEPASESNAY